MESLRLLPTIARERRIAFCNGLSTAYMSTAIVMGFVGYYLAASLPPLLAGVLLFLTPLSFFLSTVSNSRAMVDRLALVLGFAIGPALAFADVPLDLMWTGIVGGTLAYGVHRLREARA